MKRPVITQEDRKDAPAFVVRLTIAWLRILRDLRKPKHRHEWRLERLISPYTWKSRCECGAIKLRGLYPAPTTIINSKSRRGHAKKQWK